MTLTNESGYLNVNDAHLRVEGNVHASNLLLGNIKINPAYGLNAVTTTSNLTSNTVRFTNATTAFTTTGNVEVGKNLTVTGDSTISGNATVSGNATISGNVFFTSNVTTSVDSNVVVEHKGPHGRDPKEVPLKKYPEIVFAEGKFDSNPTTNTFVQAGYTVSVSGFVNSSNHPWKAFNGIDFEVGMLLSGLNYDTNGNANTSGTTASRLSASDSTPYGEWLKLELPNKIKLDRYVFTSRNHATNWAQSVEAGQVWGSNDDSNWTHLHTFTNSGFTGESQSASFDVQTDNYYKYYAFIVTKTFATGTDYYLCVPELKYYGYEEDPPAGDTSIDTTFTSVMNTPQTTGANVYVDGNLGDTFTNRVTGPLTATGTETTYDSTGKYWTLTGALTSNVTVEANTFLEGDQPHAVSVWFNSSNLEANTANTCVFTISDQENLDSYNLDLQSNTWHNLTYSYQGEGGSRVTYLDGRKVSEDQAEDTFGEYPPFAMTGYSQGGYVLSVDADHDGTNKIWKAFDGDDSPSSVWFSQPGSGDADSSYQAGYARGNAGQSVTDTDGTTHSGSWGKIEFPYKFVLNYVRVHGGTPISDYWPHNPDNYVILGSNDDTNWDLLTTRTGANDGSNGMTAGGTNVDQHPVNATKAYKYIKFLVTKLGSTSGDREFIIASLKLYGHRENDLVRLPDPTNVLKYPHIAMTGPAQRGYVASASSFYNSGTEPEHGFDGVLTSTGLNHTWESGPRTGSGAGRYTPGSTFNTSYLNEVPPLGEGGFQTTESSNTWTGEWLQIELPHSINTTKYVFGNADGNSQWNDRIPTSGVILGSTNGSTWNLVHQFSSTLKDQTLTISHTGYYKYFRLVGITVGGTQTIILIPEWELYGTGVDSVPIQIGGGNIDKVANFRVYDKFVGEDQALEIWDAQKDEFGRAKSSMTLQKGRLGIGTTEPEGRLAVADEPDATTYGLQEFPPKPLAGYETHIEDHGIFKVSVSSDNTDNYAGWKAFNKIFTGGEGWMSEDNPDTYTQGTGLPNSTTAVFNGKQGEWLHIELPYKIRLKKTTILQRTSSDHPRPTGSFTIWGSNDTFNWDEIITGTHTRTVAVNETTGDPINRDIDTSKFYSSYVFQVHSIIVTSGHEDTCHVAEWKLFGYREQVTKQSVLHDGQLTLTKSLTVPRIGPALDADDTPRRDRLVVEYNTSTNPTFEGAVRDTSGRGNDGVFYGGASYSAADKAFKFSDAGHYIQAELNNSETGNQYHSVSLWFQITSGQSSNWRCIFECGENPRSGTSDISLYIPASQDQLSFSNGGSHMYSDTLTNLYFQWHHVVLTYDGANRKMYLDGVLIKTLATTSWSGVANMTLRIGRTNANGEGIVNGLISNFKLYWQTALTASEVKTLYDMGRCDEGHHVVNFSKTRVGIGLGDGEAPRAALDVHDGMSRGMFTINQADGALYTGTALRFLQYNTTDFWDLGIWASNDDNFAFAYNGSSRGYFRWNGNNTVQNFTGQHRTFIKDVPFSQAGDLEGLIVSSDQNKYIKMSGGIESGSNAITTNESLPIVSLSTTTNDKKCFGVISASEDPEERSDAFGNFVSVTEKEKGDTRVYINSVGEGAIWVVNTGGPLESGDYITTSSVKGYGQYQSSQYLTNFTVAKITMDCDFNPAIQPVLRIKKDDDGMNILDEHGQLQWEEHPTETERAYKIRYLDANGTETDEANAVHIAAFVGCTYHCG